MPEREEHDQPLNLRPGVAVIFGVVGISAATAAPERATFGLQIGDNGKTRRWVQAT
jgi:hypothetical protein